MENRSRQTVIWEDAFSKPVVVAFDGAGQTSDAGVLLLAAADRRIGLTAGLVKELADRRDGSRVEHTLLDLLRQRVFGVVAGYEDTNDTAKTSGDPALKEACGRAAIGGRALASQATLSRFERNLDGRSLVKMGRALERAVVARHRMRLGCDVKSVTIDLDPMEDPTHGQQRFAFFNGHYDSWCYLPIFGFLTFNDEPEQYLFHARLRPGNATAARTALPLLKRTVALVRETFPKATIRVRLDGGFANPRTFDLLDDIADEYVVAVASNRRLEKMIATDMQSVREAALRRKEPVRTFLDLTYAADTWSIARRVVAKAEVVLHGNREPKDNPRFVVAKLRRASAEQAYSTYCGRGEIENRLKELSHGLHVDRTSSSSYLANQLRVLLSSTALVLYQELRLHAQQTEAARMQVSTLRERFVKVGGRVLESVRRIVISLPASCPWAATWMLLAKALGAT